MNAVASRITGLVAWLAAVALAGCSEKPPEPGTVLDEAKQVGLTVKNFPAADEDYFRDMDGGVTLTTEEVQGRNTWIVWTAGNDRFWDQISKNSVGTLDFLKTISSHPGLKFNRDNRWNYLGLVNEPCFEKATGPDPQRFGLWLDKRRADCPPDPFENEKKYPGVKLGARGKNMPVGSFYGWPTGIVGLRLFPNPEFDEAAAKAWDAKRFYEDPDYYLSKSLVKPYRVGMSCGFCHVGPSPTNPPADPENPKWENLTSNVGAQYFWVDRIFAWEADTSSFPFQLFHSARPGALDTSLVSTDYINNPRTMNAVYGLGSRLDIAKRWGKETLAGGSLNNAQFNDYVKEGPLTEFFVKPDTVFSPRVLKDGADSVGALGALNRVFLNIGLFSEEWLLHFNALTGGKPTTPIEIAVARKNSVYWQATESQTPNLALFFLKTTDAHKLKDAPGGAAYLTATPEQLTRGKEVFAERCARCHSSKVPSPAPGVDPGGCSGSGYAKCWADYWAWTKTDTFKQQMRDIVLADDFLDGNYLSTELRVPVTLLETNACSPLASNAIGGSIWDNFSSQTYKDLPSVGSVTVYHPYTGEPRAFKMPAGGRGYTRPASLISLWSTAPFLLNNTVGDFDPSPSVEARMRSFQSSIEQMLWPEKRTKDLLLGEKIPGLMDRTTTTSYLRVPAGYLPDFLRPLMGPLDRYLPWLFGDGGIQLGPIPAGTPVSLLSNLQLVAESREPVERATHGVKVLKLLLKIKKDLKALPRNASDDDAKRVFANLVDPLMELSACPDYIVNRGHYFGTDKFAEEPGLSDDDKRALIEFVKTF
ncbi:hypothetical protein [Tahibacter amnicola]|uniref:Cytochrome c domain-containing protein n=1 Tax=Tahibacter amnicola TaxID=2976241 RepID=A0ABY6BC16_9GAMM|nr:hypothetical protein [Tahibacter amnicola]UXI67352.1 hypothetical protein N4264_21845 [Tahibacter amnicola]